MEVCSQLASTGFNQYVLLVSVAALLIVSIFGLKHRNWLVLIVPILTVVIFAVPNHAQAAQNCMTQSSGSGDSQISDSGEFSLVDDEFLMEPSTTQSFSLLLNDNQLQSDLIDWQTIDLNPNSPGIQNIVIFTHPDDPLAQCGSATLQSFGTIRVSFNEECSYYDDELNYINFSLPSSFSSSYTAQTLSALQPPGPALITITVSESLPQAVVTAADDYINYGNAETTVQILDNDSTTAGTLDPLTIDLDLVTPGIQNTVTVVDQGGTMVFSVNNQGLVTVNYSSYDFGQSSQSHIPYVVANSNGDVSSVAFVYVVQLDD